MMKRTISVKSTLSDEMQYIKPKKIGLQNKKLNPEYLKQMINVDLDDMLDNSPVPMYVAKTRTKKEKTKRPKELTLKQQVELRLKKEAQKKEKQEADRLAKKTGKLPKKTDLSSTVAKLAYLKAQLARKQAHSKRRQELEVK